MVDELLLINYVLLCDGPGLGLLGEEGLGFSPSVFEEGGEAVVVEVGFALPVGIGEEDAGVLGILPKFQMSAAFEGAYLGFAVGEEGLEGGDLFGAEGHLDDADYHIIPDYVIGAMLRVGKLLDAYGVGSWT